jgi:hypothetical protein
MRLGLAWILRIWLALALGIGSAAAVEDGVVGTWTVLIPDAFPLYTFTWRVAAGGSYDEDGRESATGQPVQRTLHGRWSVQGDRLVLRQTGISYVFDGTLSEARYAGTLYSGDRAVSRFCAAKGEIAPKDCSTDEKGKPLTSETGPIATPSLNAEQLFTSANF